MTSLIEIEGVGRANAAKLNKAGVRGTNGLLKMAGKKKDRVALAKATKFAPKTLLEWVNRADLARVKGIGTQYSDLLEAAGVDTVVELAKRKPDVLLETMTKVNKRKNLVNQLPSIKLVRSWVKKANALKRVVQY